MAEDTVIHQIIHCVRSWDELRLRFAFYDLIKIREMEAQSKIIYHKTHNTDIDVNFLLNLNLIILVFPSQIYHFLFGLDNALTFTQNLISFTHSDYIFGRIMSCWVGDLF